MLTQIWSEAKNCSSQIITNFQKSFEIIIDYSLISIIEWKEKRKYRNIKEFLLFSNIFFSQSELIIRKNILFMNAKELIVTFLYIKFISFLLKILSNQKFFQY